METVINGGSVSAEVAGDVAFNELLPELEALPADKLLMIQVDVKAAVTTVLGALPEIRALVAKLTKVPPELDPAGLDKLEKCAYALNWVQGDYASASAPTNELVALVTEGIALRDTLVADVQALARRGFIDAGRLTQIQTGTGHRQLAGDLTILSNILSDSWDKIQGKCAIDAKDSGQALRLAQRIMQAVGVREQAPAVPTSATDIRLRVFTLFANRYDEVRKGVAYVRWEKKDADDIAPSLYAGRARRRVTSDAPEQPAPPVTTPPAAPAGNGTAPQASVKAAAGESGLSAAAETDPFLS